MTENEDNPEWVKEDFAQARPFKEVFPEQYQAWKNCGGRPEIERPKVHVGFGSPATWWKASKLLGRATTPASSRCCVRHLPRGSFDGPRARRGLEFRDLLSAEAR
jgi:hypothetical protein